MNGATIQCKEKAIEAIQEYRNELLKEFWQVAKRMREELAILCSTGIDKKRYVCFENVEIEQDICYTVLNRESLMKFKATLDDMTGDDAIEQFHNITEEYEDLKLYEYGEFTEMEDLELADMDAKNAQTIL